MKKLLLVFVLGIFGSSSAPAQVAADFGMFYSSLSPHGEWISIDGGTYAWRPGGVNTDWRPYYEGRWVWTDDGWYWDSEEPWAWATYHYGRWHNDDYYGWCWIPGYDWAPAWVEWRYGGSCVGWAPLGPYAVFSAGWGIHYRRYWATPYSYWSFLDCRYMGMPYVHRYVYRPEENTRYLSRTRTAGSVRYDNGRIITRGPERDYVEQRGNIRLGRTDLVDARERGGAGMVREGNRERIAVYRPKIEDRDVSGLRPDRVRTDERKMNLDTRGTDLHRREADRESGRDIRRTEEYRQPREGQPGRPEGGRVDQGRIPGNQRPAMPDVTRERPVARPDRTGRDTERPADVTRVPRSERRVERQADRPRDVYERPRGEVRRPTPMPRIEREAPRAPRSFEPRGGGMGRPESSSPRGGSSGGGRGGERGGERGGRR